MLKYTLVTKSITPYRIGHIITIPNRPSPLSPKHHRFREESYGEFGNHLETLEVPLLWAIGMRYNRIMTSTPPSEETKLCPKCRKYKPTSEFYKSSRTASGLQSYCKDCAKLTQKVHRTQSMPTHLKEAHSARALNTHAYHLIRAAQQDLCIVCGEPLPSRVDQCYANHETGELLCGRCGYIVFTYRDNVAELLAVVRYLGGPRPVRKDTTAMDDLKGMLHSE